MTPLELHVEEWKDCTRCPLHLTRRKVVPGRGQVPCDVLILGEAPGKAEDSLGAAFVGRAGHYLDGVVAEALAYFDAQIRIGYGNILGCIPVDEDGTKASSPPAASATACRPRVEEFVRLCSPKVIVCAGQFAETWTGPAKKFSLGEVPRVPMVHPAAVLRAPTAQQPSMRRGMVVAIRDAIRRYVTGGEMK